MFFGGVMPSKSLSQDSDGAKVAAVIPCHRVRRQIRNVVENSALYVDVIYLVDDCCPENTADYVESLRPDNVRILRTGRNLGVGGATMTGYKAALADSCDIIVKIDGDGQMEPSLIPYLIAPIVDGDADYTKGNRFFNIQDVRGMPPGRLLGNAALSFLTKLASGYWTIFDPTNGFTAIHARVLERLPLARISQRYFFESDMLFRLGTIRAHVVDVPMNAVYGDERSGLKPAKVIVPFFFKNVANTLKRIFYNYFLRDFSAASANLLVVAFMTPLGIIFGVFFWLRSLKTGVPATSGEVMIAALPLIIAIQMFLSFLSFDVESTPKRAIHPLLRPLSSDIKGRKAVKRR